MEYKMFVNTGNRPGIQYTKPLGSSVEDDLFAALMMIKCMYEGVDDEYDQKKFMDGIQKFVDFGVIDTIDSINKA